MIELVDVANKSSSSVLYSLELLQFTIRQSKQNTITVVKTTCYKSIH